MVYKFANEINIHQRPKDEKGNNYKPSYSLQNLAKPTPYSLIKKALHDKRELFKN